MYAALGGLSYQHLLIYSYIYVFFDIEMTTAKLSCLYISTLPLPHRMNCVSYISMRCIRYGMIWREKLNLHSVSTEGYDSRRGEFINESKCLRGGKVRNRDRVLKNVSLFS